MTRAVVAQRSIKPTRGARNIRWIEKFCRVPEGKFVGQPVKLRPWQRDIVRGIYDTPTRENNDPVAKTDEFEQIRG